MQLTLLARLHTSTAAQLLVFLMSKSIMSASGHTSSPAWPKQPPEPMILPSPASNTSKSPGLSINFCGDVMLGRLVDQLLSPHVNEPEDMAHLKLLKHKYFDASSVDFAYPWGNLLRYFKNADLNVINLETSITTHDKKWPDKAFNFRMHPGNVKTLKRAHIHYCSLANNHILDFNEEGMKETIQVLKAENIAFAGVGETQEEAVSSKILEVKGRTFAFFSASDHPSEWGNTKGFGLLEQPVGASEREVWQKRIADAKKKADVVVFSYHWGPNYQWRPSEEFRSFARFLIDAGVDIIHGTSSHHIQGIELYQGKIIFYGLGDFIDDYAVDDSFRNDLGFLYRVHMAEKSQKGGGAVFDKIELVPVKIARMQVNVAQEEDKAWLMKTMKELCQEMGTSVDEQQQESGGLVIRMSGDTIA